MERIILYCDGSAINPGCAGWGVHGYIFNMEDVTDIPATTSEVKPTDIGYSDHTNNGRIVEPTYIINAYGSFDYSEFPAEYQTNNLGEVTAIMKGLAMAFDRNIKDIWIYSDSEFALYCADNIQEIANRGYTKTNGKDYKLKPTLMLLESIINTIYEVNGHITLKWVKAHKGFIGNETADKLAYAGRQRTRYETNIRDDVVKIQTLKERKADSSIKRPDLLCLPRLYFNTNRKHHIPGTYFMAGYVTTKPDQFYIGKRSSDSIYSLLISKKPCKEVEDVISRHHRIVYNYDKLARIDLNTLFKKSMCEYFEDLGVYALRSRYKVNEGNQITNLDNEPLSIDEVPSCLAYRTIEVERELSYILSSYIDGTIPGYVKLYDVTTDLYNTDKKGLKLKPEFINSNVKIPLNDLGKDILFRYHLPERNVMKRLEKKEVKVLYGTYSTDYCVLFEFTIIDCIDGILIYTNRYAKRFSDVISMDEISKV